ncbi:unnamed protein product, partial [Nesidiocoris tenuis]
MLGNRTRYARITLESSESTPESEAQTCDLTITGPDSTWSTAEPDSWPSILRTFDLQSGFSVDSQSRPNK